MSATQTEDARVIDDARPPVEELLAALDADPTDEDTLYALGDAAVFDARWTDELFRRYEAAVGAATTRGQQRRLRWAEACHGIMHDRLDVTRALAANDGLLVPGNALRTAKVGALVVELGEAERGAALLAESDTPLARYHEARLAAARGDAARAAALVGALPVDGTDGALQECAAATSAIAAGQLGPARDLASWWDEAGDAAELPSHVTGEILLVLVRLHAADGDADGARQVARRMTASVDRHDPSAMLRARAIVGPLAAIWRDGGGDG